MTSISSVLRLVSGADVVMLQEFARPDGVEATIRVDGEPAPIV